MSRGRKPGGQPGNKNAFKHGVYAKAGIFGKIGDKLLRAAAEMDPQDLEADIAVIRTAAAALASVEPENVTTLMVIMRTLIAAVGMQHNLSADQVNGISDSMRTLLHDLLQEAPAAAAG